MSRSLETGLLGADVKTSILVVGPFSLELSVVDGVESLSEPFEYRLQGTQKVALGVVPRTNNLVGADATLTMRDVYGHVRVVTGVIAEARITYPELAIAHVTCVLRPQTHAMTLGVDSRADLDATVVDVAQERFGRAGVEPGLEIASVYATKPYRVQRGESDWSYTLRLLSSDGIHVYFDHEDGSRPVLADDSRGARALSGAPVIPFAHGAGLAADFECVTELASSQSMRPGKVSSRSFSWEKPALGLAHSSGGGKYEAYDAAGAGPATPAALGRLVGLAADKGSSGSSGSGGEARSIRLYPGRSFTVVGHPGGLDGEWFVTSVTVTSSSGDDRTFLTHFSASPKAERVRTAAPVATPKQAGLALGTVAADGGDEVFPDPHARVRVQMHWDRQGKKDASAGTWMRVGQRCTPASMMFPRAGWHVATLHEEGDVDAPWVLSRIHDGERPPTYTLPANMTRVVYKTATTPGGGTHNEIHFEDAKGREEVFWNATRDLVVHTESSKMEKIDRDATHDVGRDQRITSDLSWRQSIKQNQAIAIGHDERIDVSGSRGREVGGNDTSMIGGSRKLHVKSTYSRSVKGSRSLKVGAAQLDVSLGNIGNSAKISSVLVGGASLKMSRGNITEEGSKVGVTTVGLAKLELSKESVSTEISKHLTETVLGDVKCVAAGRYLDTNGETAKHVALGDLSVKAKLEARFEAKETITLQCGSSVLRITDQCIELSSDHISLDGKSLDTQTLKIDHNT